MLKGLSSLLAGGNRIAVKSTREGLFFGRTYLACQLSAPKSHAIDAPCIEFSGSRRLNRSCLRCYCLGALLDPENIPPSSLTSYVDELLLVISVIFAYVAGAIPQKTAISGAQCNNTDQDNVASACPLSLFALAEDLWLRLLSATLQKLQKEAGKSMHYRLKLDEFLGAFLNGKTSKWLILFHSVISILPNFFASVHILYQKG